MKVLVKKIHLRKPFEIDTFPFLARLYCYSIDKWPSIKTRFIFAMPSFVCFVLLQRFLPFKNKGKFIFKIDNTKRKIEFNAHNTQFHALYQRHFIKGYEPEVMALLDVIIEDSHVFYDIGSNWGYFSLFVASKPGFIGKIFAFEPFPPAFNDLKHIVNQAGLAQMISCSSFALSDRNGRTTIKLPDFIHSGLAVTQSKASGNIQMFKLDSLNLHAPNVLKIDVEGAECAVLTGAKKILERYKPMIIFENWRNFKDLRQTFKPLIFLKNLGYVFFHPCWLRTKVSESYFLPPEIHTRVSKDDDFTLVPLTIEDRFLRHDQINIFACHKNSLGAIYKLFTVI